jgi:hypothetical protein
LGISLAQLGQMNRARRYWRKRGWRFLPIGKPDEGVLARAAGVLGLPILRKRTDNRQLGLPLPKLAHQVSRS